MNESGPFLDPRWNQGLLARVANDKWFAASDAPVRSGCCRDQSIPSRRHNAGKLIAESVNSWPFEMVAENKNLV